MPKKITPLTNAQIKNFKPADKVQVKSDGDGLQLKIQPSGVKSWYLNYYHPLTKKPRLTG